MAIYESLAVISLRRMQKQTQVYILLLSRESSIFYLFFLYTAPKNLLCCEIFDIVLKD